MNTIKNLASIAEDYDIRNSDKLRDNIVSEYRAVFESLDSIDGSIVSKDIQFLPVYKINEGYAIDLDSLKYVVESEECTLEEAAQTVKDINYIGDTYPLYCVLPDNINESIDVESFIKLNQSLAKSGIIPASTRSYSINEAFELTPEKLEKKIQESKDKQKKIIDKRDAFKKMNPEEQRKYCTNKAFKNLITATLISLPTFGLGGVVYNSYITMAGDNTILGPAQYIKSLNTLIKAYDVDIKNFNKKLKELKSKK